MNSLSEIIVKYNQQIHKPEKEVFEHTKSRLWDILCFTSDTEIMHQSNKTKEQIKNIILDGISTI